MVMLILRLARLCEGLNPAFGPFLRPNAIPGVRYASLTSAIERGKRNSQRIDTLRERRRSPSLKKEFPVDKAHNRRRSPGREGQFDEEDFIKTGNFSASSRESKRSKEARFQEKETKFGRSASPDPHWVGRGSQSPKKFDKHGNIKRRRGKDHVYSDEVPERVKNNVIIPATVPYTTPASEFIYGTSAVDAALRCTRRKLYKLYLYQHPGEELTPEKVAMRKMALSQGVHVKMAFAAWDKLLDKMSAGRPHNGCVLEASPLPQLPVAYLEPAPLPTENFFNVGLAPQSQEEVVVNGSSNRVQRVHRFDEADLSRFPLILLIDGILDPGNLGAVIRSAYYLGVDAIVLTGRNSAPMSPVTIKASAGAAENMTILKATNEHDFIRRSRENGWRFFAADSPNNITESATPAAMDRSNTSSLLTKAPTVLMLGSEGTGLLPRIKAQADGFISIPGARIRPELGINDDARVDSLNVSVAAALLIEMLMRVPLRISEVSPGTRQTIAAGRIKETAASSFDFN